MSRAKRVMIVEDEPNIRLVFRTALLSNDYALSTAEDGEMALRYLEQEPVDLVLLDLRMPGLDGVGLLHRLRAEGNGVPVVVITAHGTAHDVEAVMRLGAIKVLFKPVTPVTLRVVVAEVLARYATTGADRPRAKAVEMMRQTRQAQDHRESDRTDDPHR